MLRLFLKATLPRRSALVDSWVIGVSSFVFAFVLVFSSSMAMSLVKLQDFFQRPHITVEGGVSSDVAEKIRSLSSVGSADFVARKFGLMENADGFLTVCLCFVDQTYFNPNRLEVLGVDCGGLSAKDIVISRKAAQKMNVSEGDRVAFVDSAALKPYLFRVGRIFDTGFGEFDDRMAFVCSEGLPWNFEITLKSALGVEVFSDFAGREADMEELIGILGEEVEPYRIHFAAKDTQVIESSLESIRFVLMLFMLLSVCYVLAFVKNFEVGNRKVFALYEFLGARSMLVPELSACAAISLGMSIVGLAAGTASAFSVPFLLGAVRKATGMSFDYYLVFRRAVVPFASMAAYAVSVLLATVVTVCLRFAFGRNWRSSVFFAKASGK